MLKGITKISLIYHRQKPTLGRTFTSREVKEVRPTVGIHDADLQICVGIFYFVVTFMLSLLQTTKKFLKGCQSTEKQSNFVNFRTILIQKFTSSYTNKAKILIVSHQINKPANTLTAPLYTV